MTEPRISDLERKVAVLESIAVAHAAERDLFRAEFSRFRNECIRPLEHSLAEVDRKLSRYQGFWGGILLVLGAFGAIGGVAVAWISK